MAATVPIVGNRRENPSVYLRPIAQATSHRPATSRNSQAMGDPPKNVRSSQFLSTLFAVGVRARKTGQRRNMNVKKKTAYSPEGRFLPLFLQCKFRPWTPDHRHPR